MEPECGVHLWTIEHTVCNHVSGAAQGFFRRLEHELDPAREPVAHPAQDRCCPEQDRHVPVMPARMHDPVIDRPVPDFVELLYGQRIHVCPEHEGLPGTVPVQNTNDTGGTDALEYLQAKIAQIFCNYACSAFFGKSQLRVPVKVSSEPYHLIRDAGYLLIDHNLPPCRTSM